MTLNQKLIVQLREILDTDFRWIKKENKDNYSQEVTYYTNAREGADKIMLLVKKYSSSLEELVPRFDEQYSRRLPKCDNYKLSESAIDEIVALTEELIQKLEVGLIKIKRFNFHKELNPFERGLLWVLGILGFSDVFQKLLDLNIADLSLSSLKYLIFALTLKSVLFFVVLVLFIFYLFYFRFES